MTFHVPEKFRVIKGALATNASWGNNGRFAIPALIPGRDIRTVASDGGGWEHVSVSIEGRRTAIPNWEEMCKVKDLFWDEDDVVIQYHPRKSDYVNNHSGCLHMWRPIGVTIPTPPAIMVGTKGMSAEETAKKVASGWVPPERQDEALVDKLLKESEAALEPFKTPPA